MTCGELPDQRSGVTDVTAVRENADPAREPETPPMIEPNPDRADALAHAVAVEVADILQAADWCEAPPRPTT